MGDFTHLGLEKTKIKRGNWYKFVKSKFKIAFLTLIFSLHPSFFLTRNFKPR